MATRLTAAKLKELQLHRHEEEQAEAENQRLRDEFIEKLGKKEVARLANLEKKEIARLANLEKAWNDQAKSLLQSAIGGDSRFYCSCIIWPDRLIDAGFKLFQHDVDKLSKAIAESEKVCESIEAQISKAHAQAIALLRSELLTSFKNIAAIKAAFAAAHELKTTAEEESWFQGSWFRKGFREALIKVDRKFGLIDTKPAADIFDRLNALYEEYEGKMFEKDTLEMQFYSEELRQEYDDTYPDDVTPALTTIESGNGAEKLLPSRGAELRVSWKKTYTAKAVNFDFTAATLGWISVSGQALFDHIEKVVSEIPLSVTNYELDVVKNIHGQFLVHGGVNKFYESPPPAFLLKCIQALDFQCDMTPTEDEGAAISLRW